MFDNNIEKIEKTDELSKWRVKINNVFSILKSFLPEAPKNKKSMLVTDGENIEWTDVPEKEEKKEITNFNVPGILSTQHIVVNNVANFRENIEVNKNITASSLLLQNNPIIRFVYPKYTSSIRTTPNGLKIDEIIINRKALTLEEIHFSHCHIKTTDESFSILGNNDNSLFSIKFQNNVIYCPNGISTPTIYFDKYNKLTANEYSGNSNSANKLSKKVRIYGNVFDGTFDLTGVISDCLGIRFATESAYIEFPTKTGSVKIQENNGILNYDGEFDPKKLYVNSDHYAEYYPCKVKLEKGDVISFDFNSDTETYVKVNKSDGHPLGVVTDDFAMIIGEKKNNSYPVCNRGRVHAKVIGKVETGDNLTVSLYDGVLRKLQPKEKLTDTWAIALESSDIEETKLVKIHII